MPDKLWSAFANNWPLFNKLFACAANTLLRWAKKLDIEIGLFVALHTYRRQLNQHPHIHLSVNRGGLCLKHGAWRQIYFKNKIVGRYWRQTVIALLRESHASLNLPAAGYQLIRECREWCQFLEVRFQQRWKIPLYQKDPTCPAKRQLPRPLSETATDRSLKTASLQRRSRCSSLL